MYYLFSRHRPALRFPRAARYARSRRPVADLQAVGDLGPSEPFLLSQPNHFIPVEYQSLASPS
jgi:hypothetical protein